MIPLKEALIDRSTKDPIKNALAVSIKQSFTLGSSTGLPVTYDDNLKDGIYNLSKKW